MNFIPVVTDIKFFGSPNTVQADCVAITFFVPADCNTCVVNGFPISAGNSLRIEQSQMYMDVTKYVFTFEAGPGENALYVLRSLIVKS